MKNLFFFLAMITGTANAQFVQMGGGTLGVNFGIGFQDYSGIDAVVQFDFPGSSADRPKVLSVMAGYEFILDDMITLTPRVGGASLTYQDFSKYDTENTIQHVKRKILVGELEFGKDINQMRISIIGRYVDAIQFGVALKYYFNH